MNQKFIIFGERFINDILELVVNNNYITGLALSNRTPPPICRTRLDIFPTV